jgi:raffinose/stachyose/melibiose transport system substrate-binding protein
MRIRKCIVINIFPQYKEISKLMDEGSLPVPSTYENNLDTVEFIETYKGKLSKINLGNVALGYLTGQVKDLPAELDKINGEANEAFKQVLGEKQNVKETDFQFADWTPFSVYSK